MELGSRHNRNGGRLALLMFYNEQHQAVKQITVKRIILERCKKKAMADVLNYYPPLKTSLRVAIDKADGKVEWKVEESKIRNYLKAVTQGALDVINI